MPKPDSQSLTRLQRERLFRKGIANAVEELDLRPLLAKVVESACVLLGADDGAVGLLNNDPLRIVMEAIHNLPESELDSEWLPGQGLAGLVLESKKPVIVNRYGEIDPNNRPELAENSVVGVPIVRRKRLIGFFGIGARPPRKFSQSDIRILVQFAKACASAIENAQLHAETQQALTQTSLLYETIREVSQSRTLEDVVFAYLNHVAKGKSCNCSIVVYDRDEAGFKTANTMIGSWKPGSQVDVRQTRIPHESDQLDVLLDSGQVVSFSNVFTDDRASASLRDLQERDGNPALVLIPLMSRGERIGLVTLSNSAQHVWTDFELHPFKVTAAHLAAAIDIRREQDRLATEKSNMALVEERKRLARDLHDSITQSLFGMQLLAQSLAHEVPEPIRSRAERLETLSRSSLKEMRALLTNLRPINSNGTQSRPDPTLLRAKIERHAEEIGLRAVLTVDDALYSGVDHDTDHALFRIAQEAISNAHKHAKATSVSVTLCKSGDAIRLAVQDDGSGLSSIGKTGKSSFGLVGMRERAEALGGKLSVTTRVEKGTLIEAVIPFSRP